MRKMVGHGFQLGLHGHQHVAETSTQFVYLDQTHQMPVISAGSLCAGINQLPRGVNRQYNLIVIHDDFKQAQIHLREMGEGEQFITGNRGEFLNGSVEVGLQAATDDMGRELNADMENTRRAIFAAEESINKNKLDDALEKLNDIDDSNNLYVRNLKIEVLFKQKCWKNLIEILEIPKNIVEEVYLIHALINTSKLDDAENTLYSAKHLDTNMRNDFQEQIVTRRMIKHI